MYMWFVMLSRTEPGPAADRERSTKAMGKGGGDQARCRGASTFGERWVLWYHNPIPIVQEFMYTTCQYI